MSTLTRVYDDIIELISRTTYYSSYSFCDNLELLKKYQRFMNEKRINQIKIQIIVTSHYPLCSARIIYEQKQTNEIIIKY